MDRFVEVGRALELGRHPVERVGEDGIHRDERTGDRLVGADRAELEAVAGESERRGAVAIARVLRQFGQDIDADFQRALLLGCGRSAGLDLLEDIGELVAEVDRNDGRRRFVRAETVVVARGGDAGAEQRTEFVDCTDDRSREDEELRVLVRRVARIEQVALGGIAQRPVDVFARAVDAGEGLLVQQAGEAVLVGGLFEDRHDELLVVGGEVGRLEERRDLELSGRDFVVAGLGRDAEFEEFAVDLIHEGHDAIRNEAEVVVLELLTLGRGRAEERASSRE